MCSNLRDYVLAIFEKMSPSDGPKEDMLRINRARRRVELIRELEAKGDVARAEREIAALVG